MAEQLRTGAAHVLRVERLSDLTQTPAWTGGNDGKLRIPTHGVDSLNSEPARILKQELAHSFNNQMVQRTMPSEAA